MTVEPSDAEAIGRSAGDPAAFVVVYERHFAAIHNFMRRRVGIGLADELSAEVFVRAFRDRSRYRPVHGSALPWLYGIASHLVADHRRAERRRLRALERLASLRPGLDPDRPGESRALSPELVRALRGLAAGDRDALLLVVWGELSYQEVADALEVPVGTVRSRIHRARGVLSQGLDDRATPTTTPGEAHA